MNNFIILFFDKNRRKECPFDEELQKAKNRMGKSYPPYSLFPQKRGFSTKKPIKTAVLGRAKSREQGVELKTVENLGKKAFNERLERRR